MTPFRPTPAGDLSAACAASVACAASGGAVLLGIDIGGTKTALALADDAGRVLGHARFATAPSRDVARDVARVVGAAHALLAEHGASAGDVAVAGVSLPGALDDAGETVVNPPNLPGWGGAPLRALLERGLGVRVVLENDANAAALAEWRYGAAVGCAHVVYLTMSTGVGGGLILGGRLHRGYANGAGEIGHVPLVWGGEPCACGLRGCVEAYIGGAAWTRRLAAVTPPASAVARLAAAAGVAPHPEHVVAAARAGDAFALAEIERFNGHLAHALCAVAAVVAPEIFVLGTIAVAAGEALCIAPVRERVRANLNPYLRGIRVEAAALGERLPLLAGIGVAQEALREGA